MTVAPEQHRRYTIAEYVRFEERADARHEFHDGEILAMSGGSFEHSLIATNFNRALGNRLLGMPCRVLDGNLRVATPRRMFYPGGSVICGLPEFDPRDPTRQSVTNPRVIVEVLSPTTESYDRGDKFDHYRELGSLEEYVLALQTSRRVETFVRQPGGAWIFTPFVGIDARMSIRVLSIEIPLAEIYADVGFPPLKTPPVEGKTD